MNLEHILSVSGFPRTINRIIITCVDPKYPVSSLGEDFKDIPVYYDDNHRQQIEEDATGFFQFALTYNNYYNGFDIIEKREVHGSLPLGVVQLAYNDSTLVIGIPGDVYAFNQGGTGFAFGKPRAAGPSIAENLLRTLLLYMSTDGINTNIKNIDLMMHPDCGLFANNVGCIDEACSAAAKLLSSDGKNYEGSEYHQLETEHKERGVQDIQGSVYSLPITGRRGSIDIRVIVPPYQQRQPGVTKIIKE